MKAIYPVTFLVSSENIIGLENDLRAENIQDFKRVLGKYKGNEETSLVVVTDREFTIKTLAKRHAQESVLKLTPSREAVLLYACGKVEPIGEFKAIGSVKPEGDYTFDGSTYYTVTK